MHIVELPEYGMEEPEYGTAISIVLEYHVYIYYYSYLELLEYMCIYTYITIV